MVFAWPQRQGLFPGVRLICIVVLHSFYLTGKFPLSPFKTREQAEKAREKYPEPLRKKIGLGVISD